MGGGRTPAHEEGGCGPAHSDSGHRGRGGKSRVEAHGDVAPSVSGGGGVRGDSWEEGEVGGV